MEKRGAIEIPSTPFAFIWFAIKPYKKWFFWAIIFVSLSHIFSVTLIYVFRILVDLLSSADTDTASISIIFWWIIIVPAMMLLALVTARFCGFMTSYFTVYARTRAVKVLFEYLSLHDLSYFNDRFSGALNSRVNDVARNVSRMTTQFIYNIMAVTISIVVAIILLFSADINLAIIFISSLIILIPLNLLISRRQLELAELMVKTHAKMTGQVIDAITNISAVQQYARRFFEIGRLDQSIKEHRDADTRSDVYTEKVLLINNVIVWIVITGVIVWAFVLWSRGAISAGQLVMVITLTISFDTTLSRIGQNLNVIMESYGEIREALKEIILPHTIIDKPNARKLAVDGGVVNFENVTFTYDKDPRLVFKDLSFNVKGGEKVGVVGTSGAGKTTLMKLLLRQHDLIGGTIYIDGQDIREVTQESLRENISIVPQEPMLFHRTIRENIMYGKLDATEEEMVEVAKKAQAHDFIEQLPQKYDSLVGERGVKLSVGQRQRVAIARAFLKNAPILVLDEATSALDSESEVAVQKALQALMEGKTVFAIAHRLSTLREMDRILVFKEGRVVEDGSHRKLLQNKEGTYASLWSHQAGGFINES